MLGPAAVVRNQTHPLVVSVYEEFSLEVKGTGLSTNHKIRVIGSSVQCGDAESAANTDQIHGLESDPNPEAGSSEDEATTLRWGPNPKPRNPLG